MFRTLILILIGYIIWTMFRIFQRFTRSKGSTGFKRGYDRVHETGRSGNAKGTLPEIRDAEFEDIDPRKDDEP